MAAADLTAARLRELLHYDPETGLFTRRVKRRRWLAGEVVGTPQHDGYLEVMVANRRYKLHRLVWLYMTGGWPSGVVDHKNGDRQDNRFVNLRVVSVTVNNQNRRAPNPGSASGLLGVSRSRRPGLWEARIQAEGKNYFLGNHETPEQAHAAYMAAKKRLHAIG